MGMMTLTLANLILDDSNDRENLLRPIAEYEMYHQRENEWNAGLQAFGFLQNGLVREHNDPNGCNQAIQNDSNADNSPNDVLAGIDFILKVSTNLQ